MLVTQGESDNEVYTGPVANLSQREVDEAEGDSRRRRRLHQQAHRFHRDPLEDVQPPTGEAASCESALNHGIKHLQPDIHDGE